MKGDFDPFEDDRRGGKHNDGFYDLFSELEIEAKVFLIESRSKKSSDFSAVELAKYVNKRFYELTQICKLNDTLVCSSKSCRLVLRGWSAKFQPNSQLPYFVRGMSDITLLNIVKKLYLIFYHEKIDTIAYQRMNSQCGIYRLKSHMF